VNAGVAGEQTEGAR